MSADSNQAIGIFDSGIGGLTVANAIIQRLPQERIIYFGDTAHLPYGDKSPDAIRYYSLGIGKFLLDQGVKMIVIACNSASSAAYHVLLEFFKGQCLFVNVVDPLVQYTVKQSYKKVGVIATKATIGSRMYEQKLKEQQPGLEVFSMATPLLVPMIEEGFFKNDMSHNIIKTYLDHPGFHNIDALLLACTHYPLIKNEIKDILGPSVDVIDSIEAASAEVERQLSVNHLLNIQPKTPDHRFIVSDYTPSFEATTQLFYQKDLQLEHYSIW